MPRKSYGRSVRNSETNCKPYTRVNSCRIELLLLETQNIYENKQTNEHSICLRDIEITPDNWPHYLFVFIIRQVQSISIIIEKCFSFEMLTKIEENPTVVADTLT